MMIKHADEIIVTKWSDHISIAAMHDLKTDIKEINGYTFNPQVAIQFQMANPYTVEFNIQGEDGEIHSEFWECDRLVFKLSEEERERRDNAIKQMEMQKKD